MEQINYATLSLTLWGLFYLYGCLKAYRILKREAPELHWIYTFCSWIIVAIDYVCEDDNDDFDNLSFKP